jgi:dTDP-glucose 4,6-dehydratase
MNNYSRRILITGGAGFIGSHLIRRFLKSYPNYLIVNLDKLTYAGNLSNLADVENLPNYIFEKVDIVDSDSVRTVFKKHQISDVIHLAAESHVDRSIEGPMDFVMTQNLNSINFYLHFFSDNLKIFYCYVLSLKHPH